MRPAGDSLKENRVVVFGSFGTLKAEPNDVDIEPGRRQAMAGGACPGCGVTATGIMCEIGNGICVVIIWVELVERGATMKRFILTLVAFAFVPQLPAVAQPPQLPAPRPDSRVPSLAAAIADGAPFLVQLDPGGNTGTLIGGERYYGQYNPDSNTFLVSGPGLQVQGHVLPVTAAYGGADPQRQQLSLWGAVYTFDSQGNLFLSTTGRQAGKLWLRR
jgi:hypothetical protein